MLDLFWYIVGYNSKLLKREDKECESIRFKDVSKDTENTAYT